MVGLTAGSSSNDRIRACPICFISLSLSLADVFIARNDKLIKHIAHPGENLLAVFIYESRGYDWHGCGCYNLARILPQEVAVSDML